MSRTPSASTRFRIWLNCDGLSCAPLPDPRSQLEASPTTRVVESPSEAQVVLQALSEAREKVVVAQTSANQIREFELRLRFTFRVRSAVGKDLIAESEIVQRRSLTYTETTALLYRSMQNDIVSQVLRRLASVRLV